VNRIPRFFPCGLVVGLFLLFPVSTARAAVDLRLGGVVKLYTSIYTQGGPGGGFLPHEAGDFALTRPELWLKLNGYASENVSFRGRVDFIYTHDATYERLSDLESASGFSSEANGFETYFREASFKVMDLFVPGLDLIAGRQRVRWGTSDEYNVIDNLNPVDYANLYSFDPDYFVDHIPMDGLSLEYQFPFDFDLKIQGVWYLYFRPSPLPAGFEAYLASAQGSRLDELTSSLGFPAGISSVEIGEVPDYNVEDSVFGIRLGGNLFNFDIGVSYYHGFQTLPLPERIVTDLTAEVPSIEGFYGYPRLDVVGFDLAGELYSVGIWAEVGVYLPDDQDTVLLATTPLGTLENRFPLLDRPYTKYTVGFDYTFGVGEGLYWNTQFNHGFYDEFGYTSEADEALGVDQAAFLGKLEDYYLTYLKYGFLNDALTVKLEFLLEVAGYDDFSRQTTWVLAPEIEYVPFDGTSIRFSYLTFNGSDATKLGAFSDSDLFYLLLKAFF
jgi:Protein of unknown function (DUF1302)